MNDGERLQKVLAHAGLGSRRAIEELIARGRVEVNGRTAELGRRVDPHKDEVKVDGSLVPLDVRVVHLLMNKPVGVVTSAADPEGRRTVLDYLDVTERVWPVGRLDMDTEGALLLTNDGELTHRLTHPSFEVPKTYLAEVRGTVGARALKVLARGVELEDGPTKPARIGLVERMPGSSLVELTIVEGRNRQVRRMMAEVGHPVKRLVRTAIGPLMLGRLKAGTARRLSLDDVRALYLACGL
ncbi:MAG: rRNA pseudouridine synthase [Actinomycetota bacterium]|nr:rRNA pseudouridine synthase [Actinomycetota bacterium]